MAVSIYDVCLTLLSHRAVARVLVVAGPDVGAALSITTLYYFIDSYLFSPYPGLCIHRLFHSIRTSVTQTSDSLPFRTRVRPATRSWGGGAQTARGGCNSCIGAEDALREEVASSIGFVLDALAFSDLGSRRGSTHNSMLLHT